MSDSYRTIQGDAWDSIAYRLWGREHLMSALLRANPEHADTLIFQADIILAVPPVEKPRKKLETPPWRQT